jgi:hypothetical protein
VGSNPATRAGGARRLTVLSPEERHALYALPDFDDFQRAEYFAFTPAERVAAEQRRGRAARIVFMLQLGYFKAKQAFFDLSTDAIPLGDRGVADTALLSRRGRGTGSGDRL